MNETRRTALDAALEKLPLVAILRGVRPDEIDAIFDALVESGFKMIEIPLNSPRAWESIERIAKRCPDDVVIGAGTVLDPNACQRLADLDAPLVITPNSDPLVISEAAKLELAPMIGCLSPTEALAAAQAGATALKLFPAASLGTAYFKDIKASCRSICRSSRWVASIPTIWANGSPSESTVSASAAASTSPAGRRVRSARRHAP